MNLPISVPNLPQKISDLWSPNTHLWNTDFIAQIFYQHATTAICRTLTVPSDSSDVIKWKPSAKGVCLAREAFTLVNSQMQVQHPNQGSRSIDNQAMDILRRMWAHKLLPPNIKAFVWRLIRRAIAAGARAGNLSNKISKYCATRNLLENNSHLFFHCNFSRAVWFSFETPLRTSLLPFKQDGIQKILSTVINRNTSNADF